MAFREIRQHDPSQPVFAGRARDLVFPAHWHEDVEAFVVLRGSAGFFLDGEHTRLQTGDGALIAPRSIHAYDGKDSEIALFIFPPMASISAGLSENAIPALRSSLLCRTGESDPGTPLLRVALTGIEAAETELPQKALILAGTVAILRGLFSAAVDHKRKVSPDPTLPGTEARILRVLAYLEESYASPVSLETAARIADLSRFYFSRLFKRMTGVGLVDWLTARRIAEADRLLRSSDLCIRDIAEEAGVSGLRALDRAFLSFHGLSPRDYRRH